MLIMVGVGLDGARAQSAGIEDLRWLAPDAAAGALAAVPRRYLRAEADGGRASLLVTLGELAFRSPRILGGDARQAGISCQTCHPNGGTNRAFLLAGVSDRPGNVDVTHRLFNRAADDGLDNPINIPSLRGIARTAPYGRDGRSASLRDFVRAVIVTEFVGAEPPGWLLDALLAYLRQFAILPGAPLGPDGRLDAMADAAARRGEALFRRPFARQPELSCANCHRPSAGFLDRLAHDVGSGGAYDTPSLLNAAGTAPYFHDGRHAGFAEVVGHFDRVYGLGLTAAERDDLVAYLKAVGAAERPTRPARLADDLAAVGHFLSVVAAAARDEDGAVGGFAAQSLRRELGRIHQRLPQPGGEALRRELIEMSAGLNRLAKRFDDGDFIAARAALPALQRGFERAWQGREAAAAGALYEREALERALDAAAR